MREAALLTGHETASGPGRPAKGQLHEVLLDRQALLAVRGVSAFAAYRRPDRVGELAHKGGSTEDFIAALNDYAPEEPRGRRLWEAELLLNEPAREDPNRVRDLLERDLLDRHPRSDRA